MLTVAEFTAIRSAGFEPLGQVMGVSVHQADSMLMLRPCRPVGKPYGVGIAAPRPSCLPSARASALDRMTRECLAIGGDGVVDVTIEVKSFVAGGTVEFSVLGTAVRAIGALPEPAYGGPLPKPFTADLTGHDFALLVRNGWLPTRMVLGLAARVRHSSTRYSGFSGLLWGNRELDLLSDLITTARADARAELTAAARRAGGLHVVVRDMQVHRWEQECRIRDDAQDFLCQAAIWGTAVTPVHATQPIGHNGILPILRLSTKDPT